ncbi:erythronate-4-phosphate dehydrogenase family protein [Wolffia australiana]
MEGLAMEEEKRIDSESHARSLSSISCSSWFEIRLFYVKINPFSADSTPDHLTLSHLRREIGVALEINGVRVPASEATSVFLRRDRIDRGASEVTYVSTDSVRLSGAVDFVVRNEDSLLICGALERMDTSFYTTSVNPSPVGMGISSDKDSRTGWSMDCYSAASPLKIGRSSPSIEVYVAGCCSGFPLILTQTVHHSPRRKSLRRRTLLDVIPEDDETGGKGGGSGDYERGDFLPPRSSSSAIGDEDEEVETEEGKLARRGFYYEDEDGQLTWFNAGVRVGVGIGLGMCLGLGLGVGLLMRSYQATTRNFKRRFL